MFNLNKWATKGYLLLTLCAACILFTNKAMAYIGGPITTKVSHIEVTFMPDFIKFLITQPINDCPVGTWIIYDGWSKATSTVETQRSNIRAVYTMLLTQKATGGDIIIYGSDKANGKDGTCRVEYIYSS